MLDMNRIEDDTEVKEVSPALCSVPYLEIELEHVTTRQNEVKFGTFPIGTKFCGVWI
jgi:hypothetical protein